MKTYYVTFDVQGQTEIVVKVEARSQDDAKYKAMSAYLGDKDIDIVDEDVAKSCAEDGVLVIDEDGEEIDLEDED